jgi:hypothetical protein
VTEDYFCALLARVDQIAKLIAEGCISFSQGKAQDEDMVPFCRGNQSDGAAGSNKPRQ